MFSITTLQSMADAEAAATAGKNARGAADPDDDGNNGGDDGNDSDTSDTSATSTTDANSNGSSGVATKLHTVVVKTMGAIDGDKSEQIAAQKEQSKAATSKQRVEVFVQEIRALCPCEPKKGTATSALRLVIYDAITAFKTGNARSYKSLTAKPGKGIVSKKSIRDIYTSTLKRRVWPRAPTSHVIGGTALPTIDHVRRARIAKMAPAVPSNVEAAASFTADKTHKQVSNDNEDGAPVATRNTPNTSSMGDSSSVQPKQAVMPPLDEEVDSNYDKGVKPTVRKLRALVRQQATPPPFDDDDDENDDEKDVSTASRHKRSVTRKQATRKPKVIVSTRNRRVVRSLLAATPPHDDDDDDDDEQKETATATHNKRTIARKQAMPPSDDDDDYNDEQESFTVMLNKRATAPSQQPPRAKRMRRADDNDNLDAIKAKYEPQTIQLTAANMSDAMDTLEDAASDCIALQKHMPVFLAMHARLTRDDTFDEENYEGDGEDDNGTDADVGDGSGSE